MSESEAKALSQRLAYVITGAVTVVLQENNNKLSWLKVAEAIEPIMKYILDASEEVSHAYFDIAVHAHMKLASVSKEQAEEIVRIKRDAILK